jgi:four helix bundle protein
MPVSADMVTALDLQKRAEAFAVGVVKLCATLPATPEARNIRDQLGRAATSVAANYRAVCRARSRAEFVAKLGLVIEEADEAHMWLGMIITLNLSPHSELDRLYREADERTAIFVASRRTAARRRQSPQST